MSLKRIKDNPNYLITSGGQVINKKTKRFLHLNKNSYGYPHVSLGTNKNTRLVHRLVAEAFIPNPNNFPQVNHKDGVKTNNHYSNLEWCTASHNIQHAFKNGLKTGPAGEKNGNAKVDWLKIDEIRKAYKEGKKQLFLAKKFGIDQAQISRIVNNLVWSRREHNNVA